AGLGGCGPGMDQADLVGQVVKQRQPAAQQNRRSGDGEFVDEVVPQEVGEYASAGDVDVCGGVEIKQLACLGDGAGDVDPRVDLVGQCGAQDDRAELLVGPEPEGEHLLVGAAPHDEVAHTGGEVL